ncbi:MAG: hypothetical protein DRJ65_07090 [Acidobacteria bacterium]|nr:MAG: hypothetical protein DRJ65_07090 [Acidobacteriota bacterium]
MQKGIFAAIFGVVMAVGVSTAGAEFHASDLIYVPVVAHTTGANESVWASDVMISNLEGEDSIDVAMVFLPSGLRNNSYLFSDRTEWVGGRESDNFGTVDERLADIPPGGSIVLEDVVEAYWPENSGLGGMGALIVFSYLADSLEDDGSREFRNISVSSRTFNTGTLWEPDPDNEGEFIQSEVTYGQMLNGVPWYNLADSAFVSDQGDFSYLVLDGARENEEFRYNIGVVNTSDRQTTLIMKIEPIQPDGQPFLFENETPMFVTVTLPPLAHVQYFQIFSSVFQLTDVAQARFKISIEQWSTTGTDPHPTFTAYGSLVDNGSNDPTTYLPTFEYPYNVDCMWPTDDGSGEPKMYGSERRALEIPEARP